MRNKKGFTLIELLSVIVILAIIALIATPIILNIIEKARKSAFTRSAENVLKSANNYYAINLMDGEFKDISFECDGTKCLSSELDNSGNLLDLNVEGNMGKGTVNINNKGNVEFELSNGAYCATKTLDSNKIEVRKGNCGYIDPKEDTTKPEIRNVSYTKTNNSIKIVVNAIDKESGISYYEYSIDDGTTWSEKRTSNIYEYTGLSLGTYKIKVRVYNKFKHTVYV